LANRKGIRSISAYYKSLEKCAPDQPFRLIILLRIASCFYKEGDYSNAAACYEQILSSSKVWGREVSLAKKGLARSYLALKEFRKAAPLFDELLSEHRVDDSMRHETLMLLGNCYEGTGAVIKAKSCYETILASKHASEASRKAASYRIAALSV
jgi:tetratricopeptide (TPR) repeat protein